MQTMPLSKVKQGEPVKLLKGSRAVYVRGAYDRSLRKYSLTRWDDINSERFVSGTVEVSVGFTF